MLKYNGFDTFIFPRRKLSDSILQMVQVCATTVHRVGLQVPPNEQCPHVPVMSWNTCAYTIQATGMKPYVFNHCTSPFSHYASPLLCFHVMPSVFGNIAAALFFLPFFNLMCFCVPALENMLAEEGKALFGSLQSRQVCQACCCVFQPDRWTSLCVCAWFGLFCFSWQVWRLLFSFLLPKGFGVPRLWSRNILPTC